MTLLGGVTIKGEIMSRLRNLVFIVLCCCMITGLTGAASPVANFTGTPTYGQVPLTVSFTDLSTNSPTGWAWYFGDETYLEPWTQMTASAGWSRRHSHSSVAMPDGRIVLMGGFADYYGRKNDVWRSTDKGATWTELNSSAGWSARSGHSSVAMSDGSIVIMGGYSPYSLNDVWRSTDNGVTWTEVNSSAGWVGRDGHSSVVMPDGSIVLMGGVGSDAYGLNDVWRSTDNGTTWTQMTASAGWSARYFHTSVAMSDGSIVLMGGSGKNDVWRSTDEGATWTQMTATAGWSARSGHSSVAMSDGSIVLMGGNNKNDVWRSTDYGATWTQLTASAEWPGRGNFPSVAMPDGSIILMGGRASDGESSTNDVWRLIPAGSSVQNPTHTYTTPGTYLVSLQVYNADGYNSTRKAGYVTVNFTAPIANFTGTPISGIVPLTVTFSDSSTNFPTSWNWSFGDSSSENATQQNPVHTYTTVGTYTVSLNVTNPAGLNTKTVTGYITVNVPPPAPVANFTGTPTSGTAPLTVTFLDSSTNSPTSWSWSFGDGITSASRNPVHTYTTTGNYKVSLNVTNAGGSNTKTSANYITVNALFPPVVNFTGTPTYGQVPLTVSFTDLSTNSPTGWAWYFGDETYLEPWTQMTASAGWSRRHSHSSVAMPDGRIVLMGGFADYYGRKNDVWRSTDKGATWTELNSSAGWSARSGHSSVAMSDGSIVIMGGYSPYSLNDVWRSTDNGVTWTEVNSSAGWVGRDGHSSVVMPDGSIVLMGGVGSDAYGLNDVWRSTDNGTTWTQMTASAGWSARYFHTSVAMSDGSIVLMGGSGKNDVWRSTDEGATWTQMTATAGWSARSGHSSVAMSDGSIVLMGGNNKNDVWRSTDYGATWTQLTASAEWPGRGNFPSVAMPDGSIILMGGRASDGESSTNDVWRLIPAGSSVQNPTHTYTTPGTYLVSLQAYNASGFDSTRKAGYVTVYQGVDYGSSSSEDSPFSITPTPTTRPSGKTITETVNVGGGSAVTRAEMTGSDLGKNLVITAFPRKSLPPGMGTPNTTVYQYISIVSSAIPGVVNQTTLDFSVPRSWLTEHGFTDGDIVMMHYENGQWQTLDTCFVSRDGGNVLYRATTPGFSYFAVAYQKGGTTTDNSGTDNPLTTPVPTIVAVLRAPVPDAVSPVPLTTEKTPAVPSAPVADRVGGIPLATIIIGTIGALAVIISTVLVRRWWTRKQNPALFRKYD